MIEEINKQKRKRYWLRGGVIGGLLLGVFHFIFIFIPLLRTVISNFQLGEGGMIILLIDLPLTVIGGLIADSLMDNYTFLFWYFGVLGTVMYIIFGTLFGTLLGYIYGKIKERRMKR